MTQVTTVPTSSRRAVVSVLVLGLLVGFVATRLWTHKSTSDVARQSSTGAALPPDIGQFLSATSRRVLSSTSDNPLGTGSKVTVEQAQASIDDCAGCPALDGSGPDATKNVQSAFLDSSTGEVAYVFKDGTLVILTPDNRAANEYLDGADELAESLGFTVIDFRGTKALAKGQSKSGPAAISWVADGYLWQVIGQGGQSVEEVASLGQAL